MIFKCKSIERNNVLGCCCPLEWALAFEFMDETFCTIFHSITIFRPNFTQIHYLDQFSHKLPIKVQFHGPPYPLKKSKLFPCQLQSSPVTVQLSADLSPLSRPSSGAMEITRANFKERLPDMEAAIDSASFLAIDGEFTGLSADKGNSPFDLPHERSDAHHVLPPGSLYHLYTNSHLYSVH